MARIKNNITKSGASLINERTRFYREQSRPVRQPYIPNGYNTDNLNIDMAFNDENTINFDNLKYSSFKKYFNVYPNERSTIAEQQATPSTFPDLGINDLGITFENFEGSDDFYNNQAELLEKFLKKENPVEIKFSAFNDREYAENNSINQDFIKGEGEYSFLDSNLYEETSIEIELDVPHDALLEYTAKMQESDVNDSVNQNNFPDINYSPTLWFNSPYSFRRSIENFLNVRNRTNSPFLIYNFTSNCFESRGYYKKISQNDYEGKDLNLIDLKIIPDLNFTIVNNNNQISDITVDGAGLNFSNFINFFSDNLKNHHLGLTNTPINHLNPEVAESFNIFNYSTLPTSQFGFPHFPTFHTFNDNLLSMKKFLNKTLIVDRVTVECDVKIKSEISTTQDDEDIDIRDGLNFSLNYFILNDSKNKKDSGLNFLSLKPQEYFRDFNISNSYGPSTTLGNVTGVTHFSSDLFNNPNINNFKNDLTNSRQNLTIQRKLWNLNEQPLIMTDIDLTEISFNKNIVSFGNVLFHASNKDFIEDIVNKKPLYTSNKIIRFNQMKNNNDLVIDVVADNILKSENIESVNDLSNSNIFLDFEDQIKVNSYVKKAASYPRYLNSNNLNYQIEFKSNLNSTLQYTLLDIDYTTLPENLDQDLINNIPNIKTGEGLLQEKTYNHTRNMLNNKLDGKDLINPQSQLLHDITKRIFARKTSKKMFKKLKKTNQSLFNQTEIDYYYNNFQASDLTNLHFNRTSNFSPYVLTPNDNLAFCFSISPTISPKLFRHSCHIKTGKVKFTLHGYMKKNNKTFQDDTNLKNLNQQNLTTVVLGNNSIVIDDYENSGYLSEYINTFNDRIFQGIFNNDVNPRKLNETSSSKILSGKSYIPYLRLENVLSEIAFDSEDGFIYDDFRAHTIIFDKMFAKSTQISNFNFYEAYKIAKELTFYKDKLSQDNFDLQVGVEFNKINSTDEIPNIQPAITYKDKFDEILNFFLADAVGYESVVAYGLALIAFLAFIGAVANTQVARQGFKKYLNRFVKLRNYGQFRDNFEQRLYTSLMKSDVIDNIKYVAEQKFINDTTGEELTNLSNPLIPRNKSKYLQLIDAGFKSITSDGVITPWDGIDFYARKHVVYNDDLTPIFA
jgi:hypothetical protein